MRTKKRWSDFRKFTYLSCILILMILCVIHSSRIIFYASEGLNIWFQRMLPSLFPFMILCGMLIRMELSDYFASIFKPVFRPLFGLSDSCIYVIVTGFLCGFPMGAKVISESLKHKKVNNREAELLLAFCNNIGPAYFSGFVAGYFQIDFIWKYMVIVYGVAMIYGLFLRYAFYRDIAVSCKRIDQGLGGRDKKSESPSLFSAVQDSILSALVSQASLGGSMIFYNVLKIIIELVIPVHFMNLRAYLSCLIEISGGLVCLETDQFEWALIFLQFGGLCCIAQTYSMIKDTELKLEKYVFHKLMQSVITFFAVRVLI